MQKLYETALDITLEKMKHKDLRNIVKIKCENGDGPMKIFRDLSGAVSLTQIKWPLFLLCAYFRLCFSIQSSLLKSISLFVD